MSSEAVKIANLESWPKGTRFLIHNQSAGGKMIVEGKATIRKALDPGDNLYEVEFDDEPGATYQRRVRGEDVL